MQHESMLARKQNRYYTRVFLRYQCCHFCCVLNDFCFASTVFTSYLTLSPLCYYWGFLSNTSQELQRRKLVKKIIQYLRCRNSYKALHNTAPDLQSAYARCLNFVANWKASFVLSC